MKLLNFIKNLFQSKSLTNDSQATATETKPRRRFKQKYGHWVKAQLKDYDGTNLAIVKISPGMSLKMGQNSVNSYLKGRFGSGKFRTRQYETARTVHVRPL